MNEPQYITPKGTFVSFPSDYHSKKLNFTSDFISRGIIQFRLERMGKESSQVNNNYNGIDNPDNSLELIRYGDNTDNPSNQTNY